MISVVIPTHNRPHLLAHALESVLNQTYPSVEIIVVDDASSYETQELLTGYGKSHAHIRVLRNEVAQGPCRSRNMGIEASRGELISFLDDDDEWLYDRLKILAGAFEADYAYICSDYWIKNAKGFSRQHLPKSITYHDMLYRNRTGNTVLAYTKYVQAVGGFDEKLDARQDYDLWLHLLEYIPSQEAKIVHEPLHIINKYNDDRLSISNKAYCGKRRFYMKHRKKMNNWQRRFQRIKLRKLAKKELTWKDYLCNWIVRKRLKHFPSRKIIKI